jgi:uncharacterized caspase-like protein/peptidoglycan hydrolase-like protein with peptidoglycan-binding domain
MIVRLCLAFILTAFCMAPAAARKVALVMGNGAYQNAVPLANPVRDARAVADKLRGLGFDVIGGYDEDLSAMQETVAEFARKAVGADIALMFYAGHGIQVHGDNFLIPIDAKFEDETALDFETVPVNFVIRQMSRNVRVRMIILDACRNNPLSRSLARAMGASRAAAVGEGLAEIKIEDPGEGTVIAFATSPGDVAYDGETAHSPFTEALLRHIDAADTPVQNVMTRVTRDVYLATEERQRPWVNASLIGEVYLNETRSAATAPAAPATPPAVADAPPSGAASIAWDREKSLFESAAKSGAVDDYRAYLAAYPDGEFSAIAENFIARSEEGGGEKKPATVAALAPADTTGAASDARTAEPPSGGAAIGTELGEAALGWDRAKRREMQTRLELAGNELGRADGAFGPRSRAAIGDWQRANGFEPSGYFTAEQAARLVAQTDPAYAEHQAAEARAENERRAAAKQEAAKKASARKSTAARPARSQKRTATTRQSAPVASAPRAAAKPARAAPAAPAKAPKADPCLSHPGHRVLWDGTCMY